MFCDLIISIFQKCIKRSESILFCHPVPLRANIQKIGTPMNLKIWDKKYLEKPIGNDLDFDKKILAARNSASSGCNKKHFWHQFSNLKTTLGPKFSVLRIIYTGWVNYVYIEYDARFSSYINSFLFVLF